MITHINKIINEALVGKTLISIEDKDVKGGGVIKSVYGHNDGFGDIQFDIRLANRKEIRNVSRTIDIEIADEPKP
jgi:hypothetical protein